jgi:hypothetical protein
MEEGKEKVRIGEVCRSNGIEDDYRVLLIVPGEWIIENDLIEEWKRRRGIPDSVEITPEWEDALTLQQADILGLLAWKG